MANPSNFSADIRSNPYFGTWNRKPVITQAPDAMIYINEEHTIPVCLECDAKVRVKDYVTTIGTSLTIDGSGGGSCNFDIQVPRSANVSFIRDGQMIIANMMEVEVWFKGAFTVNGMPRYYRAFWGYINNISDDYSDGTHSISVSCADMLSWWNVIKYNSNAGFINNDYTHDSDVTVWQTRFRDKNVFEILAELTSISRIDTLTYKGLLSETLQSEDAAEAWRMSSDQIIQYWLRRLNKISKALRVYGTQGDNLFDGAAYLDGDLATKKTIDSRLSLLARSQTLFGVSLMTNDSLFSPFLTIPGPVPAFDNDLQGRLDIMVQVKDLVGWEFFLDSTGEIVFKPPYYNVDVRQNFPVAWIRDLDVLNWNFSEQEPEATEVLVFGQHGNAPFDASFEKEANINGSFRDYNLTRQYGLRFKEETCLYLKTGPQCAFKAVDIMSRIAASRYQGTVTIPGRPELKLGMPIYLESRDCFWYVSSIQHSFAFGSSYTTTLGLTARRTRYSSTDLSDKSGQPVSIGGTSVQINLDDNGVNRDADGRNIGIPNVIMRQATVDEFRSLRAEGSPLVEGVADPDNELESVATRRTGNYRGSSATRVQRLVRHDQLRRGLSMNISGGVWVYDIDEDDIVSQVKYCPADTTEPSFNMPVEEAAIPVSDGSGYQLIGGFPYGRGLLIAEDGSLTSASGAVDNEGNPVPARQVIQEQIDTATVLRNATPDDEVEIVEGRTTEFSMGGGVLSTASVLKVDQTNQGQTFAEMSPEDAHSQVCTCVDNYTLDNLLILNSFGTSFSNVFDRVTDVDQLVEDSYQVTINDIAEHEGLKESVQSGDTSSSVPTPGNLFGTATSSTPTSPSISEAERLLNDE